MKAGLNLPKIDFDRIADDFRYMDPNDPGGWPLVPRIVVLICIFLFVLLGGWWFFWSDQLVELEARAAEEGQLKEKYIAKKRQAINLDVYVQQLTEIDRSFGALLKQLPSRAEVESLLIEINQAGLGRGLQFELFRPASEQVREFYAELPIALKINGSYHDIGAFAADIAKLPRIVTLSNVSISPLRDGMLTLDATTRTFRYLDEEELAKNRPAGGKK